jgi:hypothetical protein
MGKALANHLVSGEVELTDEERKSLVDLIERSRREGR